MKRFYAIIAILMLVFLVGCQQQDQKKTTTGKSFIGGTEGLDMKFLTGAPPDSVFDTDNPFSISVRIENKGEYSIENKADATVEITGINAADFGVTQASLKKDVPEALMKSSLDASGNIIQGTVTTVDFENLQYKGKVSGTVPFTLQANVCYEYGTKAQAKLCVLKDLLGKTGTAQLCNPNNQAIVAESSGAPVQVVSMSQNVLGANKVSFTFKIKNSGAGTLHQKGTECDSSIPMKDKIWVEVKDTGLGTLECSGLKDGTKTTGFVTLYNNEAQVRCTQTISNPADFEKLVEIELKYGYKQSIQKTLSVKQAS